MTKIEPLPIPVRSAAITVCRDALHWRDDLRAIFLTAGVPGSLYDRYDDPSNNKVKIARFVFGDLEAGGKAGYRYPTQDRRRTMQDDQATSGRSRPGCWQGR